MKVLTVASLLLASSSVVAPSLWVRCPFAHAATVPTELCASPSKTITAATVELSDADSYYAVTACTMDAAVQLDVLDTAWTLSEAQQKGF